MKHITTKWHTDIFAEMIVVSGELKDTTIINKDDIITVGYIKDESVSDITGRVDDIKVEIINNQYGFENTNSPVDTISDDIRILSMTIDRSKLYASDVITLDTRDIVESSVKTNVSKVTISPNIKASITVVSKSDDGENSEVTVDNIKVGTEISPFKFKTVDGKIINTTVTVSKFLYEERPEGTINIFAMLVTDEEGKVYKVRFKDVLSLNEE